MLTGSTFRHFLKTSAYCKFVTMVKLQSMKYIYIYIYIYIFIPKICYNNVVTEHEVYIYIPKMGLFTNPLKYFKHFDS